MRRLAEARVGRRFASPATAALALLLTALLVACGGGPAVTPDDGLDPLLIRGKVVDSLDVAVPTKFVQITLADHFNADPGQPLTVISQVQYGVAIDGTFDARLAITPEIAAFAARSDNVASFDVVAVGTDGNVVAVYVFPRTITEGRWAGEVPYLTLRSEGESTLVERPSQQ